MKCNLSNITDEWVYTKPPTELQKLKEIDAGIKRLVKAKGKVSTESSVLNSSSTKEELQSNLAKLKAKYNSLPSGYDRDGKAIPSDTQRILQKSIDSIEVALKDSNNPLIKTNAYKNYTTSKVFKFKGTNTTNTDIDYAEYAEPISKYTGEGYYATNKGARAGRTDDSGVLDFLTNAEENFTGGVYRGTRLTTTQIKSLEESMRVGALIQNTSPISTSVEYGAALAFKKGDILKDKLDTLLYIKSSGHDISAYSELKNEKEVLLKPGKYFQVLDKFSTDMQVHILLEEVPENVATQMKTKPNTDILAYLGFSLGLHNASEDNDGKD